MSEDNTLIKSIIKGDRQAFKQVYELYSTKVYNTVFTYAQNKQDAEEITQDVFIKIFKNAEKFRGDSSMNTWVYRIAVNSALNYLKKRKRHSFLSFGEQKVDQTVFEHPGILMENQENAKTLFKAIETLADSQKTAFILSFVEEMPRQEVADIMQTTLKAVESLLQRAKKNLRVSLEKRYPGRVKKS